MTTTSPVIGRLRDLKLSRTETQPQWPDPEASIGRWYRSLGRHQCWELCGPGRMSYLSLAAEIKEHLENYADVVKATVLWSAYMVGKSKTSANPTIFFCSKSAKACSEVRKEIKSSGVLAGYPCFRTAVSNRPPHLESIQQLGGDPSSSNAKTVPAAKLCNPVGKAIKARRVGSEHLASATIGAVVEAKHTLYFSTVAHIFEWDSVWDDQADEEFEFDLDDDRSESSCDHTSIASSLEVRATSPTAISEARNPEDPVDCRVDIPNSIYTRSEVVYSSSDEASTRLLDYCLVRLKLDDKRLFPECLDQASSCDCPQVYPTGIVTSVADADVVAYTSSQKCCEGQLSTTPTFASVPGGISQEYWSVQFERELALGDCGSAVLDKESSALVGHIVAGSVSPGTALVVPAHLVFEDIRRKFDVAVQLSNTFSDCSTTKKERAVTDLPEGSESVFTANENPSQGFLDHQAIRSMTEELCARLSRRNKDVVWRHRITSATQYLWHHFEAMNQKISRLENVPSSVSFDDIPLVEIQKNAKIAYDASLRSTTLDQDPEPPWSQGDWMVRKLLHWFRSNLVSKPTGSRCLACNNPTEQVSQTSQASERAFLCMRETCYLGPWTRNANITSTGSFGHEEERTFQFAAICRALTDIHLRLVWCPGFHWLEVFSSTHRRWIHVDVAEGLWNKPLHYVQGLGLIISYCIAFSTDGAADVTRRYSPDTSKLGRRELASEAELRSMLDEIRTKRRQGVPQEQLDELLAEDEREKAELDHGTLQALCRGVCEAAQHHGIGEPLSNEPAAAFEGTIAVRGSSSPRSNLGNMKSR